MSKEFEEIVLKKLEKLDKLEEKANNTDQLIQDVVLKKLEKLDTLEAQVGNLEIEVKDSGEVINYLNKNFTRFDYEINKKIDTLFDAYATCKEKDVTHEENIVSLNTKTFNHDIRISNLEDRVLTA